MMPRLIIFSLVYFFSFFSYAQKTVNPPLEKGEVLLDFVDLQENGFVIKTGKDKNYSKDLDWVLSYYSPELNLIWKVPIETSQMNKGLGEDIITCPSGKYIYHLENRGYNAFIGTSEMYVTQISKSGQTKVTEIDKETYEKIGGAEEIKLCDEEYLYLIGLEQEEKKETTTLFLNRFAHKDFAFSNSETTLPSIIDDKSVSDWEYAGHNDKHIWLVSKTLSEETDDYKFQLVGINWQGQIEKELTLNTQIADLYLRPSRNFKYSTGAEFLRNGHLNSTSSTSSSTGVPYLRYSLDTETWSSSLVDENNNIIYVYGLYGNKKLGSMGKSAYTDGFYLIAYDLQGKQLWQHISTENDPLLEDKYFQKKIQFQQRTTLASLSTTNTIKLQIGSIKNIYTYEFSKEGKKLDNYSNTFDKEADYSSFFLCFSPKAPAHKYYYTNVSKKSSFYASISPHKSVLIKYDGKNDLSLLHW